MTRLMRHEWTKMRRERTLWFALLLHLAPLAMVVAAAAMGVTDGGPESRYFILHNQSVIVAGIVSTVVTSAVFQVELANRTWFEWLMLPAGRGRLLAAKAALALGIQGVFIALTTTASALFLGAYGARGELPRLLGAYLVLHVGTALVMTAMATLLCLVLRSVLIVNILGIGATMVTMVVMSADFSWALPTCWAYRAGLTVLDAIEYGYPQAWALGAGGAVTALLLLIAGCAIAAVLRSPRVLNATRD